MVYFHFVLHIYNDDLSSYCLHGFHIVAQYMSLQPYLLYYSELTYIIFTNFLVSFSVSLQLIMNSFQSTTLLSWPLLEILGIHKGVKRIYCHSAYYSWPLLKNIHWWIRKVISGHSTSMVVEKMEFLRWKISISKKIWV